MLERPSSTLVSDLTSTRNLMLSRRAVSLRRLVDADALEVSRSRCSGGNHDEELAFGLSTFKIPWRRLSALLHMEIHLICMEWRKFRLYNGMSKR